MHITAIYNYNFHSNYSRGITNPLNTALPPKVDHANDVFIKSSDPTFTSNTSAGSVLKKLRNITCPYTGIKMLPGAEVSNIERRIDNCESAQEIIKVLSKYKKYMQKTEKKMFEQFENYINEEPDGTFPEYLQKIYDESLTKLKLEEFLVLDDINLLSRQLSPETAFALRKKIARCSEVILENNKEDTFKRKILLMSLDEIELKPGEEEIFEKIKDRAMYLPTSWSSENAFVVKYAYRTQEEIAKRIIRPSAATIEHIVPDSKDGKNELSNFILVSAGANSYRSNMPLEKMIERFPDIPKHCQTYINEIIKAINKKTLNKCETYPYEVKKTLERESNGKIKLDIQKYKYTEAKAQKKLERHKKTKK